MENVPEELVHFCVYTCMGERPEKLGVFELGLVSALRLPDAPNIMFNDINFLLNGPRFDFEVRRRTLVRKSEGKKVNEKAKKKEKIMRIIIM